jgi:hypothetical protein
LPEDAVRPAVVVALAGQRVDAPGRREPRFPLENAQLVSRRIRDLLSELKAGTLVCSAACGADLLALEEARALGLRRHVILPFDAARFRETSVVDCPGGWDATFDRVLAELKAAGEVETLNGSGTDVKAYAAVNRRILEVGQRLAFAASAELVAVTVWDGRHVDWDGGTSGFVREALRLALRIVEVPLSGDTPSAD